MVLHPRLLAPQSVQRALRLIEVVLGQVGVALRAFETSMAEKALNRAHVRAVFQQMRGETVPEGVKGNRLLDLRP